MYVCMCVCVCVCMYVYMYVCIFIIKSPEFFGEVKAPNHLNYENLHIYVHMYMHIATAVWRIFVWNYFIAENVQEKNICSLGIIHNFHLITSVQSVLFLHTPSLLPKSVL